MARSPLTQSFANLYFTRLNELRPAVEASVRRQWGDDALQHRVKTLDVEPDENVLVIGTLYKEMTGKPNMMEESTRDVLQDRDLSPDLQAKYCGEGDTLVLEDESGRITLAGSKLDGETLVTGVVLAVRGVLSSSGELEVSDFCLPGLPPQPALPRPAAATEGGRYVAIVSGLRVGDTRHDMLPLQMLLEHLTGQIGCAEDQRQQASIVRLIIAGDATCPPAAATEQGGALASLDVMKKLASEEQQALSKNVRSLDQFLTMVTASMPVDLMPGATDPCNYLLPQQPFHHCMLPLASQQPTLNMCTNPHACSLDGVSFLGSSGQFLDDMVRYLPTDDRLETLADSLSFQHIAPTAPDTIGCFPFTSTDPFIVKECPHVYFAGNQPAFQTKLVEGPAGQRSRVVLVPDFTQDQTCALVNLDTLECTAVSFGGLETDVEMSAAEGVAA